MPTSQLLAISLMFCAARHRMLASMSETSWSDPDIGLDMSELPTGTVTLLLADVEGSTRLWETQPAAMKSAVDRESARALKRMAGGCSGDEKAAIFAGTARRVYRLDC